MAYPTFPDYPEFLVDNYKLQPADNVDRTEFEDGYVKQDPLNTRQRYEVPVQYRLHTQAEQLAFESWRRQALRSGALHFEWYDPVYHELRRARIVGGTVEYTPLTDRFDEWTVSFSLEYWV
ncbi:hypothetical protein [Pigmentiphaga kullae]|uniref:Phage tail protein n=1 Tax=Pigmentiphaga kullae TaxID=151784 RepID=A0A4V2F420_9BURK|nr:hypothetical protein [Pigmentiphaga kullae]RZS86077.1 hypothetical protein EV675_2111 [Pigmentiphaga kullae]